MINRFYKIINNRISIFLKSLFFLRYLFAIFFISTILFLFIPNFFDNVLRSNLSIAIVSFFMAIYMYMADISKKGYINLKNYNLPQ